MPNGAKSTLHLSVSDATGNSAIFEYIQGRLIVHEGKDCQVMTNSPTYDKQMTLNDYWKQIGGMVMLPERIELPTDLSELHSILMLFLKLQILN